MTSPDYSLAELLICACAETWRGDGELMATGITPVPRIASGLAKLTFSPDILITDAECWFIDEPVPLGPRDVAEMKIEGWAPYARTFDILWTGKRHAMVAPTMIDRFGQTNISVLGDHAKPKTAWLGARGFPGNKIHHPNSFFFPVHNTRSFVSGEVDFVCSPGYNPARWPSGKKPPFLDLRLIVTNLAVMDFGGPENAIRVVSLHPGVTFEQVQDNTGFALVRPDSIPVTPAPTDAQLTLIRERLDPNGVRKAIFKGDPPGDRRAA